MAKRAPVQPTPDAAVSLVRGQKWTMIPWLGVDGDGTSKTPMVEYRLFSRNGRARVEVAPRDRRAPARQSERPRVLGVAVLVPRGSEAEAQALAARFPV